MRAALEHFQVPGQEDEAAELSQDVLKCKLGLSLAELWALPVHHLLFQFFNPPIRAEEDHDALQVVIRGNRRAARPVVPMWILPDVERN